MSNETDNNLSLLASIIQEELELARSGDGYEEKGVAEEIVRDHVAPLLAAKARVTPESAIVGDIVRLHDDQEARVVAARPAGKNFIDVQFEDGQVWYLIGSYEIVQRAQHPAVSDAVASAHLSGVDVPADHVETLGAVARGEVTADDAVRALIEDESQDPLRVHFAIWHAINRVHCGQVQEEWLDDWARAVNSEVVQPLRKKYAEERDTALRKLALVEAATPPAGDALVDLVEARRLLRQRNVAYGRASATIGQLRGQLALTGTNRFILERNQAVKALADAGDVVGSQRADIDRLRAERDEAREHVKRLVMAAIGGWWGWGDDVAAKVDLAVEQLDEDWAPLLAALRDEQPDTEATEQARTKPVMEVSGWCERCGCDVSGENHYHCAKCGQRTSMMGHRDGCPPAPAPAARTEPRVWRKGDPMPEDVWKVRDVHGDIWTRNVIDEWTTPETKPCGWPYMAKKWAPLTEVIEDGES